MDDFPLWAKVQIWIAIGGRVICAVVSFVFSGII
jgi:hypothetical protein